MNYSESKREKNVTLEILDEGGNEGKSLASPLSSLFNP